MTVGLVACTRCVHRRGLHKGGGRCGVAGCGCETFVGTIATLEEPTETSGKGVWIAVPDGYVVTIVLTPVEPSVDVAEEEVSS